MSYTFLSPIDNSRSLIIVPIEIYPLESVKLPCPITSDADNLPCLYRYDTPQLEIEIRSAPVSNIKSISTPLALTGIL